MAVLVQVAILLCLAGVTLPARVNIEEMDYDSILSLLSEYEADNAVKATQPIYEKEVEKDIGLAFQKPSISSILAPNVEVLRLVEAFIKLKGDVVSRASMLISDNWDLFRSVFELIMDRAGTFHSFTLTGISVIRKILEFAVNMIASWEVKKPQIGFGFNL